MKEEAKPLVEITRRALEVLTRELGTADTLRFLNQLMTGYGDYAAERPWLFGEMTLDLILTVIRKSVSNNLMPRSS